MKIPLIIVLTGLILIACNRKSPHEVKKRSSHTFLQRLGQHKAAIDQRLSGDSANLAVFVKLTDRDQLLKIKNGNWPDSIEYTLNVLTDKSGKIILIAQMPFSESGDWDLAYRHYFDQDGHTFCFEKEESIFDGSVSGHIVRHISDWYYRNNFTRILETDQITDLNNRTLKRKEDEFEFRNYKFKVYKNLNDCLLGYHLGL